MAKQRKLNKNLIAFLTVMGMLLVVAVVAIAARQQAQRDPAVYANAAAEKEKAGDLQRAIDFYRQAYSVKKEAKYLVEAARCAWDIGEVGQALVYLDTAHAAEPADEQILNTILERNWELKDYTRRWVEMREFATRMLSLKPDHPLALLSHAIALDNLTAEDAKNAERASAALARAVETSPTDPRVIEVRAIRELDTFRKTLVATGTMSLPRGEFDSRAREYRERAATILQEGLQAHPAHPRLSAACAQILSDLDRHDEAEKLLDAAAAAHPRDPEIQVARARYLLGRLGRSDVPADRRADLFRRAEASIQRAIEVDPTYFEAHLLHGSAQARNPLAGEGDAADAARLEAAVAVYEQALKTTVGARSLRAILSPNGRAFLMFEGFRAARMLQLNKSLDDARRAAALEKVKAFVKMAEIEKKDQPLTLIMQGEVAIADGQNRVAIQAFARAEEKTRADPALQQYNLITNEYLAGLYRSENEPGLALQYADRALSMYAGLGGIQPLNLLIGKVSLLGALDRNQEALDLAVSALQVFPESEELFNLRLAALSRLDRQKEADELLAERGRESPAGAPSTDALAMQARLRAQVKDYAGAAALLTQALEAAPENAELIQLYAQVMTADNQREAARVYLAALRPRVTNPRVLRLLDVYEVSLGVTDPEERFTRLKAIVDTIEDPTTRYSELYSLYENRGDLVNAAAMLDELEKLAPQNSGVLEFQFRLAMRREQWERAEKYASRLAVANADLANGAIFRGDMAMALGDAEKAVREYRNAATQLPTDSNIKVRLAQALMAIRPPASEEAEVVLREALQSNPQNFIANKLMYLVLEQLERREEGVPFLKAAAKLNPLDDFIRSQSDFIAEESDPRGGIAKREEARRTNPEDIANLIRLAELYGAVKDTAQTDECYAAAAALDPANRDLARSAALHYAQRGDRTRGEQFLTGHIAAQQERGKVQGQLMLARFYELVGDLTAARDAFIEARELVDRVVTLPGERKEMSRRVAFAIIDFYYRVQLVKEMIEACRYALTLLDPMDVAGIQRARLRIIEGLLKTRRLNEVEQELATYLKDFPEDARGLVAQAQFLLTRNRLTDARDALTRVLQDFPSHEWSLFTRGTINVTLRNYEEARSDLQKVKQLSPRGFGLQHRLRLAQLYEQTGKVELAEAELREILALEPANQPVATELLRLLSVHRLHDKATALVSEFMTRFPQEPYWPLQLGLLLTERNEHSQAVGNFHRAVDLSKGQNLTAVALWLRALARSNRPGEAITAFENAHDATRVPAVRCAYAEALIAAGRRDDAVRELDRALADAASRSYGDLLACSSTVGELLPAAEVRAILEKQLANPATDELVPLRLRLALARVLLNEARDADAAAAPLKLVDEVIAASGPQSPERVQALLVRAQALEVSGDADGMFIAYEQVLAINDRNVMALNNLAYALADRFNRSQEALVYAQRANELADNDPEVLDTVGWVLFLNGRTEEAQAVLADALRLAPNKASVQYHLGEVYAKAGRVREAQVLFRRARELAAAAKNADLTDKIDKALQRGS